MASKRSATKPRDKSRTVPRYPIDEALTIPRIIRDMFGGRPMPPREIALVLGIPPKSERFRLLMQAAAEYNLIEGTTRSEKIELTSLGRAAVNPVDEATERAAKRDAILRPDVFRGFLLQFDGGPLPPPEVAKRVLEGLGVAPALAERTFNVITDNVKEAGLLNPLLGAAYLDLNIAPVETLRHSTTQRAENRAAGRPQPSFLDGGLRRNLQVDAYMLQERLGAGFSAEVWSAAVQAVPPGVQLETGQTVAVKFYYPHAIAAPDQVIRIEREYRIASALRHPNLIRIYEFILASSRPHHNFVVMDVARGKSLKELVGPVGYPMQKTLRVAQQILWALDELHAAGALHRDIKPGNIAVADEPTGIHATLLDLGIISVAHERSLTAASRFLGSKHWAPYEQLVGDPIDRRSDLYSVGAVVYHMITGETPYATKPTEAAIAIEMSRRPLRLPPDSVSPGPIRDLVNACLSTDPASRPGSTRECLEIIDRFV